MNSILFVILDVMMENTEIALKNNCKKVIGFDFDLNAIENALKDQKIKN